jgi:dTDP-4-dehydrorhamnose reductase
MSRILITGGSSYLGQHLIPLVMADHEVCYTFYHRDPLNLPQGRYVDIRDAQGVKKIVTEFAPEIIIHTAGSNRSPDMSQVITEGAENIRAAAYFANARLIHISTDVIFDGENGPYRESDSPNPSMLTAKPKLRLKRSSAACPATPLSEHRSFTA